MPTEAVLQEYLVNFEHVSKSYKKHLVLNDVSFKVRLNEIIALLGVNGAGKTTTINLLLGQQRPDAGKISLFNRDPQDHLARVKVSSTPQNTEFPDGIKVKELLAFVQSHYHKPHSVEMMIDIFELKSFLEKKANKLSGGQKRKLSLALAFIGNAELIFLDEPTTGLDVESRKTLWEYLKIEAKNGKTIFLTTHYLEEVEQIASRILFLQNGCIKIDGSVEELKKIAATTLVKISFNLSNPIDFTNFNYCEKYIVDNNKYILETRFPENLIRELVSCHIPFQHLNIMRENLETAFLNLTKVK